MKTLSKVLAIVAGSLIIASGIIPVVVYGLIVVFEPFFDLFIALCTFGMSLFVTPFVWLANIGILFCIAIGQLFVVATGVLVLLAGILNKKPLYIIALVFACVSGSKWALLALAACILGLVAAYMEPQPEVVPEEEPQEEVKEIEAK